MGADASACVAAVRIVKTRDVRRFRKPGAFEKSLRRDLEDLVDLKGLGLDGKTFEVVGDTARVLSIAVPPGTLDEDATHPLSRMWRAEAARATDYAVQHGADIEFTTLW